MPMTYVGIEEMSAAMPLEIRIALTAVVLVIVAVVVFSGKTESKKDEPSLEENHEETV